MGEQKWATVSPLYCCDIETGPTTPMIVNMIFFFEWEKGETDDFETHVAFAWLQKRNENVCIVRESNPGRPRGRRAFYHWTNDACCTPSWTLARGSWKTVSTMSECQDVRILKRKHSRSVGFEPTPAERNWFLVSRLNHSATTACHCYWTQRTIQTSWLCYSWPW